MRKMKKRTEKGELRSDTEYVSDEGVSLACTDFWLQKRKRQVGIKEMLRSFEGKKVKISVEEIK